MADEAAVDTPSLDECGVSTGVMVLPARAAASVGDRFDDRRKRLCVPILSLVVLAYRFRCTFDDGVHLFRSVDQILAGNGPVFNAGERVESFTSPLWLADFYVADR